jgi:hypothetical protein
MKIQSASSSEVFDNYSKTMMAFLNKRANAWYKQILDGLKEGKIFSELLPASGKTLDDFVLELSKEGKSADEIAQLTQKNISEINKILKVVPDASQVAMEAAQDSAKLAQTISESFNDVKKDAISISEIADTIKNSKDLEGKTLKEISDLYQFLRKSRNTLKNNATRLREALREAEQQAVFSAKDLAEQKELVRGAESLLSRSADEQLLLSTKIMEMGGKLDDAGNVIKVLEDQVSQYKSDLSTITDELELVKKVVSDLQSQGIRITEENNLLIQEAVKQAQLAEFYKDMALTAKFEAESAGEVAGPVIKATEEAAQEADRASKKAAAKVLQTAPQAKNTVNEATETAKKIGKEKANKVKKDVEEEVTEELRKSKTPVDKNSFSFIFKKKIKEKLVGQLVNGFFVGKAIKFISVLGVGYLAYRSWLYFNSSSPDLAKQHIRGNQESQRGLLLQLKKLKFNPNSTGKEKTDNLILALEKSFKSLGLLSSGDLSEELFNQVLGDLSNAEELLLDYESNKELISILETGFCCALLIKPFKFLSWLLNLFINVISCVNLFMFVLINFNWFELKPT